MSRARRRLRARPSPTPGFECAASRADFEKGRKRRCRASGAMPGLLGFQHVVVARKPPRRRPLSLTVGMISMNEENAVGAVIDDSLLDMLADPDHVLVLRTLRLVFSQQHHRSFPDLMRRVGRDRVRRLYRMALSADFNQHLKYAQSLAAAKGYLSAQS